nr:methylthioribose kinase [Bacillus kexueae]
MKWGKSEVIQRFIELGEGYSDIYELIEIAKRNRDRISYLMAFHSTIKEEDVTSLVIVLNPTNPGDFQPIYICREGIPNPHKKPNKRFDLFAQTAEQLQKDIIELNVKPSTIYPEKELYYQHLIGILRMNRYLPPMQ